MASGSWYWVSKAVIQKYTSEIGFLSVAVYHFLASMADENQRCYPSQQYVAKRLGCSRQTVNKALKNLVEHQLIHKEKRNRYHCAYHLLQVRCNAGETQMSTSGNSTVPQVDTNKTTLTRSNNNTFVCVKTNRHVNEQRPVTRKELLASDIAETLDDQKNIKRYLSYVNKYPELILREFLSQVKNTPIQRIKKSRASLFAYLINLYDQQTS